MARSGPHVLTRRAWTIIIGGGATTMLAVAALALSLLGPGLPVRRILPQAPVPEAAPELAPLQALTGPITIAIQPGHWRVSELPDELWRLRESTGASYRGTKEVDINRGVASALSALVEARGWKALILPATIPTGLRADAFVAIHADWGANPGIRGWKVAPPWRASPASARLAAELAASFAAEPGRVEDALGITVSMRGYFAFSYRRFSHSLSPFTPAAIVELGFITNDEERSKLRDDPGYWARIIMRGLEGYIAATPRGDLESFRPVVYPWVKAESEGLRGRSLPDPSAPGLWTIEPGTVMLPVDSRGSWYEVFVPRRRQTAWVPKTEVEPTPAPARALGLPVSNR